MEFVEELVAFSDKESNGCVILREDNTKICYIDGLLATRYGTEIVGEFGDEIMRWLEDCPELSEDGDPVIWEKIDSEVGKYYRIESGIFTKDETKYRIHKVSDITQYMELNRDMTKYVGFFKKLSKFQAAVLDKLSNSYYDLMPMLSDYYITNKVFIMIQHEDSLDVTTYTKVGAQFANDRLEISPKTVKVFRQDTTKDLTLDDFDESVREVFVSSGSGDDAKFRCLCQGDVNDQKYAVYIGIWPNTDQKSLRESVVINVIKLYIENGIMRENLIYESEHDHLTGLFNKGKYLDMVENTYPGLDSIAYYNFDVNNLKKLNDSMGHEAGDRLLIKAADSIRKVTNKDVHGYRMGGDEFLMVACNVTKEESERLTARWEQELARLNTLNDGIDCVVACGVVYAEKPYNLSEISKQADELMYEDKKRKKKPGEEIR